MNDKPNPIPTEGELIERAAFEAAYVVMFGAPLRRIRNGMERVLDTEDPFRWVVMADHPVLKAENPEMPDGYYHTDIAEKFRLFRAGYRSAADALQALIGKENKELESDHCTATDTGARSRSAIGPRPTVFVCTGCPAYETEKWREPSGDGETYDNGQYAWCNAADRRSMGAYHYDHSPAPEWCPALPNVPVDGKLSD